MAEYVPGDHLLLKPNPDYRWGPSVYKNRRAQAAEIEFRFFTDAATRSPALESGEADIMGEIPPQDAKRLESSSELKIQVVPIPGVSLMFFLNTTRPPLDDVRVRRALLYGTDRKAIISTVFQDLSPLAYGPLAANTLGYNPAVQTFYPYDSEKAAALLAEAGWTDSDGDGLLDKAGQKLVLTAVLMGWGSMPEASQLLESQWQALGIQLASQVVSYPEALQIAQEGSYHLIPFNLSGSDPDILRKFFHSEASFNWSKIERLGDGRLAGRGLPAHGSRPKGRPVRTGPAPGDGRGIGGAGPRLCQLEWCVKARAGPALRRPGMVPMADRRRYQLIGQVVEAGALSPETTYCGRPVRSG